MNDLQQHIDREDTTMRHDDFDYVACGDVKQGEWMLRTQAEAARINYRELTEEEAEEIDRQLEEF